MFHRVFSNTWSAAQPGVMLHQGRRRDCWNKKVFGDLVLKKRTCLRHLPPLAWAAETQPSILLPYSGVSPWLLLLLPCNVQQVTSCVCPPLSLSDLSARLYSKAFHNLFKSQHVIPGLSFCWTWRYYCHHFLRLQVVTRLLVVMQNLGKGTLGDSVKGTGWGEVKGLLVWWYEAVLKQKRLSRSKPEPLQYSEPGLTGVFCLLWNWKVLQSWKHPGSGQRKGFFFHPSRGLWQM